MLALEENRDYLDLTTAMGINHYTAYGIIARHQRGLLVIAARGGRRHVKLNDLVQQMVRRRERRLHAESDQEDLDVDVAF